MFLSSYDKVNFNIYCKVSLLWYVIGSGAILVCLLLTKQLALFSIPVLVRTILANLYICSRKHFGLLSGTIFFLIAIGVLLLDFSLTLKEGYFSHLQYIFFGGGSSHINKISGNGFNIWMFIGRDMWSSSTEPFFSFLTPRDTGIFLFLIFLLALKTLYFNVLLSSTHERYLYHFYPFVLITYLGLRQTSTVFSRDVLAVILTGSVLYGAFVWRILAGPSDLYVFRMITTHQFQSAFHLGLFLFLTMVFVLKTDTLNPKALANQ